MSIRGFFPDYQILISHFGKLPSEVRMPEIDQMISHYRIVKKIGQGGMGEVYLADDTTLDRRVAMKFLPGAFNSDPERMARLEREAKLLASRNHTYIAPEFIASKRRTTIDSCSRKRWRSRDKIPQRALPDKSISS